MSPTERDVLEALRRVPYPGFSRDIVACGVIRQVRVSGDRVEIELSPGIADPKLGARIEHEARQAVEALEGVARVTVRSATPASLKVVGSSPRRASAAEGGALDRGLLPDVRHTLAVASGKGGVGKSTVAVNLAVALARRGWSTGLLDVDIYGPSIPKMAGLEGEAPRVDPSRGRVLPFEAFGLRVMSLGFLVPQDSAVIWRGPLVMKAIEQLLRDTDWGALDVLVLDMPPGTGDAQLTVSQKLSLAGALIVTTPQDVALADATKGVAMFRKVGVPVLGIVENMSYFHCPHCSQRSEIFGHGGGSAEAERLGVPFLGEIPLDAAIRLGGDRGEPIVGTAPDAPQSRAFVELADRVRSTLEAEGQGEGTLFERFRKIWRPACDV